MRLKCVPEDFVVVELPLREPGKEGTFLIVELAKRNVTTERAVSELAAALDLPRKAFGYCGVKDSRALTRQRVSIRADDTIKDRIARLRPGAWSVRVLGRDHEPLSLGALAGNRFEIVARDIGEETLAPLSAFPNYFDEQRFSSANVLIGRAIFQGEFLRAARLVIASDDASATRMREHLDTKENDAVTALRMVPKHTLLMYAHAYQSSLFNDVLSRWIHEQNPDARLIEGPVPFLVPTKELPKAQIPLVGFTDELEEPFASWYAQLLAKDGLTSRDLIVRALPFLTLEGASRSSLVPIRDLVVGSPEADDLHAGKRKQRVAFSLPKGAYATLAMKSLYGVGSVNGSPAP